MISDYSTKRATMHKVKDRETGKWTGEIRQRGIDTGKMMFVNIANASGIGCSADHYHRDHKTAEGKVERFATIHTKGAHYWSGIGQPAAYATAFVTVVRIHDEDEDVVIVEDLFEMPAAVPRFTPEVSG